MKAERELLLSERQKGWDVIGQLQAKVSQTKIDREKQRSVLIADFTKQVEDTYCYAYRRCKQKHKIVEDFDTDEDFVTDEESSK